MRVFTGAYIKTYSGGGGGQAKPFSPSPVSVYAPGCFEASLYACYMSFLTKNFKFSIFSFPAPGSSTNFTKTPILDELPVLIDEEHLVLLGCLLLTDRLELSVLLDKDQASFLTLFLMICDGI